MASRPQQQQPQPAPAPIDVRAQILRAHEQRHSALIAEWRRDAAEHESDLVAELQRRHDVQRREWERARKGRTLVSREAARMAPYSLRMVEERRGGGGGAVGSSRQVAMATAAEEAHAAGSPTKRVTIVGATGSPAAAPVAVSSSVSSESEEEEEDNEDEDAGEHQDSSPDDSNSADDNQQSPDDRRIVELHREESARLSAVAVAVAAAEEEELERTQSGVVGELLRRKRSNLNAATMVVSNLRQIVESYEADEEEREERSAVDGASPASSREAVLAAIEEKLQTLEHVERLLDVITEQEHKSAEIDRLAAERAEQIESLRIAIGNLGRRKDMELLILEWETKAKLAAERSDAQYREAYRSLHDRALLRDAATSTITPLPDLEGSHSVWGQHQQQLLATRSSRLGSHGPTWSRSVTPTTAATATPGRRQRAQSSVQNSDNDDFDVDDEGNSSGNQDSGSRGRNRAAANDGTNMARARSLRVKDAARIAQQAQHMASIASGLAVNRLTFPETPAPSGNIVFLVNCAVKYDEHVDAWDRELSGMLSASVRMVQMLVKIATALSGYIHGASRTEFRVAFGNSTDAVNFCVQVQDQLLDLEWGAPLLRFKCTCAVKDPRGENKTVFRGPRIATTLHVIDTKLRARAELDLLSKRTSYVGPDAEIANELMTVARGGEILMLAETWDVVRHRLPPMALGCIANELDYRMTAAERQSMAMGRYFIDPTEGAVPETDLDGFLLKVVQIFTFDNKYRSQYLGPPPRIVLRGDQIYTMGAHDGEAAKQRQQQQQHGTRRGMTLDARLLFDLIDNGGSGTGGGGGSGGGAPMLSPSAQQNPMLPVEKGGALVLNLKPFRTVVDKSKAAFVVVTIPFLAKMLGTAWGLSCWALATKILRECLDAVNVGKSIARRKRPGGADDTNEESVVGSNSTTADAPAGGADTTSPATTPRANQQQQQQQPPDKRPAALISQSFDELVFIFRSEPVAILFSFMVNERLHSAAWPVDLNDFYRTECQQTTSDPELWGGVRVSIGIASSVPIVSLHRGTGLYQYDGLGLSIARELCCYGRPGEILIPNTLFELIEERGLSAEYKTYCLNPYKSHRDQRIFAIFPGNFQRRFEELGVLKAELLTKLLTNIHELQLSESDRFNPHMANRRMSSFALARSKLTDTFLVVARNMCTSHVQFDAMMRYVHAGVINEKNAEVFIRLLRQGVKEGLVKDDALANVEDPDAGGGNGAGSNPPSRSASRASFSRGGGGGGDSNAGSLMMPKSPGGFVAFGDDTNFAAGGGGGGSAALSGSLSYPPAPPRRKSVTMSSPIDPRLRSQDGGGASGAGSASDSLVDEALAPLPHSHKHQQQRIPSFTLDEHVQAAAAAAPPPPLSTSDNGGARRRRGKKGKKATANAVRSIAAQPPPGEPYIPVTPPSKYLERAVADAHAAHDLPVLQVARKSAHQTMGKPPPLRPSLVKHHRDPSPPQQQQQQQQQRPSAPPAQLAPLASQPSSQTSTAPATLLRQRSSLYTSSVPGAAARRQPTQAEQTAKLVRSFIRERQQQRSVKKQLAKERRREEQRKQHEQHQQAEPPSAVAAPQAPGSPVTAEVAAAVAEIEKLLEAPEDEEGAATTIADPVDEPTTARIETEAAAAAPEPSLLSPLIVQQPALPPQPPAVAPQQSQRPSSSSSSSSWSSSDSELEEAEAMLQLAELIMGSAAGDKPPPVQQQAPPSLKGTATAAKPLAAPASASASATAAIELLGHKKLRVRSMAVQCDLGPRYIVREVYVQRKKPMVMRETRYGSKSAALPSSVHGGADAVDAEASEGIGENHREPPIAVVEASCEPAVEAPQSSSTTTLVAHKRFVPTAGVRRQHAAVVAGPKKTKQVTESPPVVDANAATANVAESEEAISTAAVADVVNTTHLDLEEPRAADECADEELDHAVHFAQRRDAVADIRHAALLARMQLTSHLSASAAALSGASLGGPLDVILAAQHSVVLPLRQHLTLVMEASSTSAASSGTAAAKALRALELVEGYLLAEATLRRQCAVKLWRVGMRRHLVHKVQGKALAQKNESIRRAQWSLVGAHLKALGVERAAHRDLRDRRAMMLAQLIDDIFDHPELAPPPPPPLPQEQQQQAHHEPHAPLSPKPPATTSLSRQQGGAFAAVVKSPLSPALLVGDHHQNQPHTASVAAARNLESEAASQYSSPSTEEATAARRPTISEAEAYNLHQLAQVLQQLHPADLALQQFRPEAMARDLLREHRASYGQDVAETLERDRAARIARGADPLMLQHQLQLLQAGDAARPGAPSAASLSESPQPAEPNNESPRMRRLRERLRYEEDARQRRAEEQRIHELVASKLTQAHDHQMMRRYNFSTLGRAAPTTGTATTATRHRGVHAPMSPPLEAYLNPSTSSAVDPEQVRSYAEWLARLNRRIFEHTARLVNPFAGHVAPPPPPPAKSETDPRVVAAMMAARDEAVGSNSAGRPVSHNFAHVQQLLASKSQQQ